MRRRESVPPESPSDTSGLFVGKADHHPPGPGVIIAEFSRTRTAFSLANRHRTIVPCGPCRYHRRRAVILGARPHRIPSPPESPKGLTNADIALQPAR